MLLSIQDAAKIPILLPNDTALASLATLHSVHVAQERRRMLTSLT